MNSTHRVEVVPIVLEPHPNAGTLSIVRVWNYTVVVRTEDWADKNRGAYIPPDSVVPNNETFAFLSGKTRIGAKRLRGILSYGLLVPAPKGAQLGEDVAALLGVTHYQPPISKDTSQKAGWEAAPAPSGFFPTFGVEALLRYGHLLNVGESIIVTEKIHGESARFHFDGERMHIGSHNEWKKESDKNNFWRALRNTPALEAFCRANPDLTVYAEVCGYTKGFDYGSKNREPRVFVFDLLRGAEWLNAKEARQLGYRLPWVPILDFTDFESIDQLREYTMGTSWVPDANHIREGIVVKPLVERAHPECGRVCFKLVSEAYYNMKHA